MLQALGSKAADTPGVRHGHHSCRATLVGNKIIVLGGQGKLLWALKEVRPETAALVVIQINSTTLPDLCRPFFAADTLPSAGVL